MGWSSREFPRIGIIVPSREVMGPTGRDDDPVRTRGTHTLFTYKLSRPCENITPSGLVTSISLPSRPVITVGTTPFIDIYIADEMETTEFEVSCLTSIWMVDL